MYNNSHLKCLCFTGGKTISWIPYVHKVDARIRPSTNLTLLKKESGRERRKLIIKAKKKKMKRLRDHSNKTESMTLEKEDNI